MLHDTPSKHEMFLRTDRAIIEFSLASEGTKVSMRALLVLLGLIT